MELDRFIKLPVSEVAQIVREAGPQVCVFPINGTRRWFLLEFPPSTWELIGGKPDDFLGAYLQACVSRQLELFRLFFDHGMDTLMMPLFGPDLLERGDAYLAMAAEALRQLAVDPQFLDLYQAYQLRVRFYGDYRRRLRDTPAAGLIELFDQVSQATAHHQGGRLLFGVFGNDPAENVAEIAVQYYLEHLQLPDKQTIIQRYFGEIIPPVSLFIGFDKFSAFDMPLIATGSEDLYFTVSPSPYLTQQQLREILFDHLFSRSAPEPDYEALTPEAVAQMRAFYHQNQENTLGVGFLKHGIWYPLPQVGFPDNNFANRGACND